MTSSNSNFNSKNDRKPIVVVALAITTIITSLFCSYLYYDHNKLKSANTSQLSKLDSITLIKSSLDNEIIGIKNELTQYKGTNKELEKALAIANQELSEKEIKIKKLITSNASVKKSSKGNERTEVFKR